MDLTSGAHTNNVEAYWKRAKAVFKQMNGTSKDMVPSYLDEFMWKERYGSTFDLAFINILRHISERETRVRFLLANVKTAFSGPPNITKESTTSYETVTSMCV